MRIPEAVLVMQMFLKVSWFVLTQSDSPLCLITDEFDLPLALLSN